MMGKNIAFYYDGSYRIFPYIIMSNTTAWIAQTFIKKNI